MKRTLVIGDIHGGLKAVTQVLERSAVSQNDKLIFLGDYVDGWSESEQTISFLIDLSKTHDCVFIKGNHDVWCEEWLRTNEPNEKWLFHGGQATVDSYKDFSTDDKTLHLNFFEKMKFYFVDKENNLFIHAGFTSMHGPENEFHNSNFSWDRTLWEMALAMDKRIDKDSKLFPKRLLLFHEIYIGHTPTLNFNIGVPMQGCNVWNIDTGAAFTGKLSMLDINTKAFWQSDPLKSLYTNESGRNKK